MVYYYYSFVLCFEQSSANSTRVQCRNYPLSEASCTKWESVRRAVRALHGVPFSNNLIHWMRSAEILVGMFPPLFYVEELKTSNGNDATVYDAKQTAYRAWCRARNADHWGQFVLARVEAQRVYGVARESHNDSTRNTLKHSPVHISGGRHWKIRSKTGVKSSIPAVRGPGGGLVVAPAEKASLLSSLFDRKHCCEEFVTTLSCFPQSRCNSLAFRTHVPLRLLLDLDTYGVLIHSECFVNFKR